MADRVPKDRYEHWNGSTFVPRQYWDVPSSDYFRWSSEPNHVHKKARYKLGKATELPPEIKAYLLLEGH